MKPELSAVTESLARQVSELRASNAELVEALEKIRRLSINELGLPDVMGDIANTALSRARK